MDGDESRAQPNEAATPQGARSADGKHCPSCGKDIGFWPVFTAGLPDRIRCPHCKCRLRYENASGVVVLLLVALLCIVYPVFELSKSLFSENLANRNLFFAVLLLVAWIPVEWAVVRFLRERRKLISTGS